MKKLLLCAAMALFTPSCAAVGDGLAVREGRIPVERTARILRTLADNVVLYDLDKDGYIDGMEYLPLGLALTSALQAELTAQ